MLHGIYITTINIFSHVADGKRLQPSESGTGTVGWCLHQTHRGSSPTRPEAFALQTQTPGTSGADASKPPAGSPGCHDEVALMRKDVNVKKNKINMNRPVQPDVLSSRVSLLF